MAEGINRYVAIEFAIDAVQQVEIKTRSHAGGIVVGYFQNLPALDPIHAISRQARSPMVSRMTRNRSTAAAGSMLPMVEPGKKPSRS